MISSALFALRFAAAAVLGTLMYGLMSRTGCAEWFNIIIASIVGANFGPTCVDLIVMLVTQQQTKEKA